MAAMATGGFGEDGGDGGDGDGDGTDFSGSDPSAADDGSGSQTPACLPFHCSSWA